jgi:hypothetical protein
MIKKQFIFFLVVIFIFLFNFVYTIADEIRMPNGNEISPFVRGDNNGYLLDSDKMYILYYVADGKFATIQYKQSFFSYFACKQPVVAMNIYSAPWFDKRWVLIKKTGIDIIPGQTQLILTKGVYKFEIKNYGECASAIFKVK